MNKSIKTTNIRLSDILEAFVDDDSNDLDYEEAFNNQSYYQETEQRMRYILATFDNDKNKFFECIIFPYKELERFRGVPYDQKHHYIPWVYDLFQNRDLLLELMNMSYDDMCEYVENNELEWLGDDFDHINEYVAFLNHTQNTVTYSSVIHVDERGHGNDYMTISKMLVVDKIKKLKEELKFLEGTTE